ncbi:hypothetical protein HOY82DRAFT_387753 [Tuber indicum]|nr:hypothetical protein HOY82DRAFT_387753 [Tuber indicum]
MHDSPMYEYCTIQVPPDDSSAVIGYVRALLQICLAWLGCDGPIVNTYLLTYLLTCTVLSVWLTLVSVVDLLKKVLVKKVLLSYKYPLGRERHLLVVYSTVPVGLFGILHFIYPGTVRV